MGCSRGRLAHSAAAGRRQRLHESLKSLGLVAATIAFTILYLRKVTAGSFGDGLGVGIVWTVVVVALDLVLYLLGAFNIGLGEYFTDVASAYLVIPVVTVLIMGYLRRA